MKDKKVPKPPSTVSNSSYTKIVTSITKIMLVVTISTNGGDPYRPSFPKLGRRGVCDHPEDEIEIIKGIRFDHGYSSSLAPKPKVQLQLRMYEIRIFSQPWYFISRINLLIDPVLLICILKGDRKRERERGTVTQNPQFLLGFPTPLPVCRQTMALVSGFQFVSRLPISLFRSF